jgi:uncharacterized protein (DUF1786 family)
MRNLAIDMGTGTQDILLFDSSGPVENSVKMVMPSATKIAEGRIRRATTTGRPVVLTGVIQGGGPCNWALEDHLRAGGSAFATPEAAQTFDDDLEEVVRIGIRVVSDDEAKPRVVTCHADLDLRDPAGARRADVAPDFDGVAPPASTTAHRRRATDRHSLRPPEARRRR